MNKKEAIIEVSSADISKFGWVDEIMDNLDSMYAQGYMNCFISEIGNTLLSSSEDYREAIIYALDYDIWK